MRATAAIVRVGVGSAGGQPAVTEIGEGGAEALTAPQGGQGIVQLRLTIGEGGVVRSAEVVSGHPQLRESALEASKKMIFACDQCQAEKTVLRHISIKYQIKGKPTEDRQEKVRRSGDDMITVTITPLPTETRSAR